VQDEWLLPTLKALLTPEQVAQVQADNTTEYWATATRLGFTADDLIIAALSARFTVPIADVTRVSKAARDLVPESLMRKYRVLPLAINDSVVEIATSNPNDLDCESALAFALGRTVSLSLASPSVIAQRLDEVYRPENIIDNILTDFAAGNFAIESITDSVDEGEFDLGVSKATERPIIQLVDRIVAAAIQAGASDIHIEPEESGIPVRYRIDGVLSQAMVLPKAAGIPLVSRIKIMAELDIADRKRPQDGRARVAVSGGRRVDLRVSTLPASLGEKVVIRILDQRATTLTLDSLGITPNELKRIQTLLQKRDGIIFVTGPTGSGKTTTLYSALGVIQARGVNIVTVEDPVEYRLPGIVQVQASEKGGLTFAAALRSILRQDPDVILVGEIRDRETAMIAVQASLTGHLVLATLHTVDAVGAVARLLDIGVEPYKVASALRGVIAQRLLRRLCPHCKQELEEAIPLELHKWFPPGTRTWRAAGCDQCAHTGYRRRLAVTQVLVSTPEFERRVTSGDPQERLSKVAREGGMRELWDSAADLVRSGETSLEEMLRVLEPPDETTGRARMPTPLHMSSVPASKTPSRALGSGRYQSLTGASFELLDDLKAKSETGGKRILVVEDDASLRAAVRAVLEGEGFTIHEASDGTSALDQVDKLAPDAVVLDLHMAGLDGYGVLTRLRARPATASLPVLILTANDDEASEVRAFELGASDFLIKPFRASAIAARLSALIHRTRR